MAGCLAAWHAGWLLAAGCSLKARCQLLAERLDSSQIPPAPRAPNPSKFSNALLAKLSLRKFFRRPNPRVVVTRFDDASNSSNRVNLPNASHSTLVISHACTVSVRRFTNVSNPSTRPSVPSGVPYVANSRTSSLAIRLPRAPSPITGRRSIVVASSSSSSSTLSSLSSLPLSSLAPPPPNRASFSIITVVSARGRVIASVIRLVRLVSSPLVRSNRCA